MPGKSWPRCRAMTVSSGTSTSSPIGRKRGSTSLGTFTRAKVSWPRLRVPQPHGEREREVRDVRERPARADRQRREDREDLLGEQPVDLLQLRFVAVGGIDDANALLRERRRDDLAHLARVAAGQLAVAPGDQLERLLRRPAVGPARVDAGVDLVVQARHAHHEELVEVRRVDREELDPLQQRQLLVLRQLQHALVEVEPRELPVEVELGRLQVGDLNLFRGSRGRRHFHAPVDCRTK